MIRVAASLMVVAVSMGLVSCGGSSSDAPASAPLVQLVGDPNAVLASNEMRITVDQGPPELGQAGQYSANSLFASVTICAPGTTQCQTIDDVLVDTGSTGLRILAPDLNDVALPAIVDPGSSRDLRRCQGFLDGTATWGSVVLADVQLGERKVSAVPIHLVADPVAGAAPSSCTLGQAVQDVVDLGARGILGVGASLHDCGSACVSAALSGGYYTCLSNTGGTSCSAVTVGLESQIANPIAKMSQDNNGVLVKLPAIPEEGALSVVGSLVFGLNTQTNNALGNAALYKLDSNETFLVNYNNHVDFGFIDSGSNGLFFNSSIRLCSDNIFYCPLTPENERVRVVGYNAVATNVDFQVANAEDLVESGARAMSNLGATFDGGASGPVALGLPFFFGRSVFVLYEGQTIGQTQGPAVGF